MVVGKRWSLSQKCVTKRPPSGGAAVATADRAEFQFYARTFGKVEEHE